MAKPPILKGLTFDIPEEHDWIQPAVDQLNSFMQTATSALAGRLTLKQNIESQTKTLTISTGADVNASFPITFDCTLSQQPTRLQCAQKAPVSPGATFDGALDVSHWSIAQGKITLAFISGLNPHSTYRITLTIE